MQIVNYMGMKNRQVFRRQVNKTEWEITHD